MALESLSVLAIDTAIDACSVAICIEKKIIDTRFKKMLRGQSEALLPMIIDIFNAADCDYSDFNCVAVTRGPGSFTGVRIGLATAHGIALASKILCVGATTLEILAFQALEESSRRSPVLVAIDTKRESFFCQIFSEDGHELLSPQIAVLENVPKLVQKIGLTGKSIITAGHSANRIFQELNNQGCFCINAMNLPCPDASWLAKLTVKKWQNSELNIHAKFPEPLYLRYPDITPSPADVRA